MIHSNIYDIHDYDEIFLEGFITQTLPIYDLWNIRPLENENKILAAGTSKDIDKFRDFFSSHLDSDYPHPILIVIGNAEKNNPDNMVSNKKNYYKLKFDKYKGNDIGTPLHLPYRANYPTGQEQMVPLSFNGYGPKPQLGGAGMQGVSYNDIQGIVDRNVSDATRSIKAEYEENSARREADSIKRIADLEMRMELYKLDMRARDIEEKERKLQEELDDYEMKKAEGLGSVKEYTKTIAGGLLEVGKTAFGIEDKDEKKTVKKTEKQELKGSPETTTSFDDEGFSEKKEEPKSDDQFENLLGVIGNLNQDQKYALLDVLMPDDIQNEEKKETEEKVEEKTEEKVEENNNQEPKKEETNEEVSTDDNN